MGVKTKVSSAAIAAAMVATAACTTNPYTGQREISRTAVGAVLGAGAGYVLGDVVGGRSDRAEKIIGAGIGAVAGGAIGAYMDRQEAELRRETAGTGVDIIRQGDELLLRMPAGITFDFNSYAVRPEFRATLDDVARTLVNHPQTYVDVLGHTDSVGSAEYNQRLSEQRARAVADYLVARGVNPARIATRGYGLTMPIATNDSEAGRAQNRRVEIKIVPVRQEDFQQPGY
ncbi:MAG TPA: OmpA family protein [Sphingomicrobium sp.]|nr:OmpA family protein [Sphingomicrobium sp.]